MTHATPGAPRGASPAGTATGGAPGADAPPDAARHAERQHGREHREHGEHQVRDTARHIAGRLGALPRLAAAGAARARDAAGRAAHRDSDAEREAARRALALDAAESGERTDWAHVGIFSAGIAVGALIGAGAALLLAPATGFETRTRLVRRARHTGVRAADRIGDLSENARRSAKRGARRLGRATTSARWAAEDAWERRRARD